MSRPFFYPYDVLEDRVVRGPTRDQRRRGRNRAENKTRIRNANTGNDDNRAKLLVNTTWAEKRRDLAREVKSEATNFSVPSISGIRTGPLRIFRAYRNRFHDI